MNWSTTSNQIYPFVKEKCRWSIMEYGELIIDSSNNFGFGSEKRIKNKNKSVNSRRVSKIYNFVSYFPILLLKKESVQHCVSVRAYIIY